MKNRCQLGRGKTPHNFTVCFALTESVDTAPAALQSHSRTPFQKRLLDGDKGREFRRTAAHIVLLVHLGQKPLQGALLPCQQLHLLAVPIPQSIVGGGEQLHPHPVLCKPRWRLRLQVLPLSPLFRHWKRKFP